MTRADAHIAKAQPLQGRLQILVIENVCKQTSDNVRFNMDDSGLRGVDTEQALQITSIASTVLVFTLYTYVLRRAIAVPPLSSLRSWP